MNQITVRYFASVRAASGVNEEVVDFRDGATVADVLRQVETHHGDRLRQVLSCSSLLIDELVVHDRLTPATPGSTVDVLPPFAGG